MRLQLHAGTASRRCRRSPRAYASCSTNSSAPILSLCSTLHYQLLTYSAPIAPSRARRAAPPRAITKSIVHNRSIQVA